MVRPRGALTGGPSSPAEQGVATELSLASPGLVGAYAQALPLARAAVLSRLWRALVLEPLPWVRRRTRSSEGVTVWLTDGRRLHGPRSDPYDTAPGVRTVELEGAAHRQAAQLVRAMGVPHGAGFAAELDHSTASLALSLAGQRQLDAKTRVVPESSWQWEQRVVEGHPYHPNCRSRPGFTAADQLAYAPEHRPLVNLDLVAVPREDVLLRGAWPARLQGVESILVPVHPWQAEHVLPSALPRLPGFAAHPLMSLRTLAPVDGALEGALHVKTALSTRLTSSVRDISVYSVDVAASVSAFAEALCTRLDGRLHITATIGAATAHSPDLAAVLREPPERYLRPEADERLVPVAALAGTEWANCDRWRAEFARLAVSVCLRVLDLGVALEAHGQNLLLITNGAGAPLRLVYRDLADIRISPARLARHGIAAPTIAGRLVTDDEGVLRRKLFGSLLTGALGAVCGSSRALAAALSAAVDDLPRTSDTRALMTEPLPTKALTLMRLYPDDQGDRWASLPNPLR
ncbi:IucA/IucC family protein [Streptomyces sp. NPDC006879]|uniref:IucA/IucC family protein n=1 Tax=Streptomyces sp. NPDC006879 TaxID=3364767 RepID=UPI0036D0BB35